MWDAMLAAEFNHSRGATHTKPRLQRPRLVVDAGVDDAAVVSALVTRYARFLLEQQKPLLRKTPCDLQRNRESDNSAAHDDNVVARGIHGSRALAHRQARRVRDRTDLRKNGASYIATRYWTIKITDVLWLIVPDTPCTVTE